MYKTLCCKQDRSVGVWGQKLANFPRAVLILLMPKCGHPESDHLTKILQLYNIGHAEFIFEKQKSIFIYFLKFLNIKMTRVVETLPYGNQGSIYPEVIPRLLITWQLNAPDHQQPWYWPRSQNILASIPKKAKLNMKPSYSRSFCWSFSMKFHMFLLNIVLIN